MAKKSCNAADLISGLNAVDTSPKNLYQHSGYVVIRDFFSDIEILRMMIHIDRIFDYWMIKNKDEAYQQKLVNIHSLTKAEYFSGLAADRIRFFNAITPVKLTNLLSRIFGPGLAFNNTQLFFNPLNKLAKPYWHRDMQFSSVADKVQQAEQENILALHIRIPMIKEKGVELIPGTHQRWDTELERNVRFEINGHSNYQPLPDAELIDLKPGDVLIFNSQMIHRGHYQLNAKRKALDLCVGKKHNLINQFLDKSVLPSDDEMRLLKNSEWFELATAFIKEENETRN